MASKAQDLNAAELHRQQIEQRIEELRQLKAEAEAVGDRLTAAQETELAMGKVIQIANEVYSDAKNQDGIEWEELFAVGAAALTEAADRWDPEQGDLEPYARPWVKGAMRRHCEGNRNISLTQDSSRLLYKVRKAEDALSVELRRVPTTSEIADRLGITEQQVNDAISYETMLIPMHEDAKENRLSTQPVDLENIAAPQYEDDPQPLILERILAAVDRLPELPKQVINHRFGLNGTEALTVENIADRFNITEREVAKIERAAIADLRHPSNIL